MQVIIISSNGKGHKHWHLSKMQLSVVFLLFATVVAYASFTLTNWYSSNTESSPPIQLSLDNPHLSSSDRNVYTTKLFDDSVAENFYARQLGGLQAETIRLKMLSQRLAELAGFDASEFLLESEPGQGGIEHDGNEVSGQELTAGIEKLSLDLQSQHQTLAAIEQFLLTKETITDSIPNGRPIESGWVSSNYGYRIDPFNGRKTFHEGLDLAGKSGTPVNAVADGIVSWVGKKSGYGGLVEVDHGNGYVTRYAHNKTITVKVGERVNKGQQLALMGSTGRSTGPHVHYEILRDGKHVNPYNFLK